MKILTLFLFLNLIHLFAISQNDRIYKSLDFALQNPDLVINLNLSNTGLSSIPKEIQKFTQLKTLFLYDNQISHVPDWLKDMKNLTNIYLGGNTKLDSLNNLAPMTWIEGIDLSNMELQEIPAFIFSFKKLDYLKMTKNKIAKLPTDLNDLHALKVLNLSYNNIKIFPEYLSLEKLEILFLSSNPIESIPSTISGMTSLVELYIGSSEIKKLPNELLEISTLAYINAKNTKIKSEKLKELKRKNSKIYWD